jgi:dienelactone hydrolase
MEHVGKLIGLLGLLACATLRAETTPLNQPLQEEQEITIACELTQAPKQHDIPVFQSQKDSDAAKGAYHYKLWLPKGYLADAQRRWPCMFIASAGGNAGMGNMAGHLKSGGYIVVMLVESKNGPWPPIIGNFLAAHDDAVKRVRIQEGLKFATGMSGGARASSVFAQIRPGFTGLIMQGAGAAYPENSSAYLVAGLKRNHDLLYAITMGDTDSNKVEVAKMRAALATPKLLVLEFKGGHQWAPIDVFDRAIDWMERQIYVDGPARADLKPVYMAYFNSQLEKWRAATTPWERYKLDDSLLTLARSRNLTMEPSLAPALREMQAEAFKLRTDPAIAKESLAADALRRLEQSRDRTPPAKFSTDCLDLARRYPGTEAAAKAQEMAGGAK